MFVIACTIGATRTIGEVLSVDLVVCIGICPALWRHTVQQLWTGTFSVRASHSSWSFTRTWRCCRMKCKLWEESLEQPRRELKLENLSVARDCVNQCMVSVECYNILTWSICGHRSCYVNHMLLFTRGARTSQSASWVDQIGSLCDFRWSNHVNHALQSMELGRCVSQGCGAPASNDCFFSYCRSIVWFGNFVLVSFLKITVRYTLILICNTNGWQQ